MEREIDVLGPTLAQATATALAPSSLADRLTPAALPKALLDAAAYSGYDVDAIAEALERDEAAEPFVTPADVAAATVLFVLDAAQRRLLHALGHRGPPPEAGPRAGTTRSVAFGTLLYAGANAARHLDEWLALRFVDGDYVAPSGPLERERFTQQMHSIAPIREALGIEGRLTQTVGVPVVTVLAGDAPSWESLRERFGVSIDAQARHLGFADEATLAQHHRLG